MKRDDETTVQELKDLITKFASDRDWAVHHTPKNLAISISIEAAELLEHFQFDKFQKNDKEAMAAELVDILSYAFNFAATMDIDIATAYRAKLENNAAKFPLEVFGAGQGTTEDYFKIKQAYRQKAADDDA